MVMRHRRQQDLFFVGQLQAAGRLGFIQMRQQLIVDGDQLLGLLVAGARLLGVARLGLFHRSQIGQGKLGADHFDVGDRIDATRHMHDVFILEAAHHIDDGVGLADVGQKLVAQTLALRRPGDQTGNVDEFDDGREDALRPDDLGELLQTRVRHFDDADIGLDGAERVVLGSDARLGEGIEQGGLADIGQTDDTAFQTHVRSSEELGCIGWRRRLQADVGALRRGVPIARGQHRP
jgi:hypothetical protein